MLPDTSIMQAVCEIAYIFLLFILIAYTLQGTIQTGLNASNSKAIMVEIVCGMLATYNPEGYLGSKAKLLYTTIFILGITSIIFNFILLKEYDIMILILIPMCLIAHVFVHHEESLEDTT